MNENTNLQPQVRALLAITRAIDTRLGQEEILSAILENIVVHLGYRAATLRLLDEERQQLELKAAYGLSEAYLTKGTVDVAKSGVDRSVLAGQAVAIADAGNDPALQYPEAARLEGLGSLLAVPLAVHERVIGVVHLYTAAPHQFSPEEQALIAAFANLGAQAIQRAHLYEAFQKIAHHVTSSLKLGDVLSTMLTELVGELNVKAGSIRLFNPERDTLHLAAAYGLSDAYLQKGPVILAQSPIDQRVMREGDPVAITDLSQESVFQYPEAAQREGIRSVLVLPLRVRSTVIGMMRLYSTQLRRFSAEEVQFADVASDLGALAVENAKLHEVLKQRLEAMKEDVDGWYRFMSLG
jgi:GAF domain-containing protein